jgi:hypothetical protein
MHHSFEQDGASLPSCRQAHLDTTTSGEMSGGAPAAPVRGSCNGAVPEAGVPMVV